MPDTALAVAFEQAGYVHPIDEIALEAWRKWPAQDAGGARRDFVRGRLQRDPTWTMIERWQPSALTMAIGKLLNDTKKEIEAERPSGGGHGSAESQTTSAPVHPSRDAAQAAGDRHSYVESHARHAVATTNEESQATPRSEAAKSPASPRASPPLAPNLTQLADKQTAANRANIAVSLSLLDTFRIDGRPIGDLTPNQARTWARKSSIPPRFVILLTANLPVNDPIRKHRRAEDTEAIWKQAEEEARTAEVEAFRAA